MTVLNTIAVKQIKCSDPFSGNPSDFIEGICKLFVQATVQGIKL